MWVALLLVICSLLEHGIKSFFSLSFAEGAMPFLFPDLYRDENLHVNYYEDQWLTIEGK